MQFSRKYFITIIGHYRQHVSKGVEKLYKLGIKPCIIAPAHGLIWRRQPEKIVEAYRQWALGTPVKGKVVIVYFSAYDAVERVIGIIVDGLTNRGTSSKDYDFTDVNCPILGNVLADIIDAEALVVGLSTYETSASPVAEASLSTIESKAAYKKFVAVIVLYRWGPPVGKKVAERLEKAGCRIAGVVDAKGVPERNLEGACGKACRGPGLVNDISHSFLPIFFSCRLLGHVLELLVCFEQL